MRILFSSDFYDPANQGGAGRVVQELAVELSRKGHELQILSGASDYGVEHIQLGGESVEWSHFPYARSGRRGLGFIFETKRAIRKAYSQLSQEPDIVIHNQPLSADYLKFLPMPSFYIFHSPWPVEYLVERCGVEDLASARDYGRRVSFSTKARSMVEKRALLRSSAVFTLSKSMQERMLSLYPVDKEIAHICPGGADFATFKPLSDSERSQARKDWGIGEDQMLMACVRRLVSRTGVDLLIDSFDQARKRLPNAKLLIAGSGPMSDILKQKIAERNLSEQIQMLGYIPDEKLPLLLAAADLALVPTRALEGFGLSTLEALVCDTPVLATPVGGSVEILESLDPRLLSAGCTVTDLSHSLAYWHEHKDELAQMRKRCRSFVEANYSWGKMASSIEECINSQLSLV